MRIKNFDFWIQRRNKEATNLADKYMELENKMESIQNKMNSNQENLKKWNAKREKKQTFEENIVNLKNDLKNIQNQIKETNNKLNANLQTQNQWKEKYKIVVEKMVVEIEEIAHQDYCKEAKETYIFDSRAKIDINNVPVIHNQTTSSINKISRWECPVNCVTNK